MTCLTWTGARGGFARRARSPTPSRCSTSRWWRRTQGPRPSAAPPPSPSSSGTSQVGRFSFHRRSFRTVGPNCRSGLVWLESSSGRSVGRFSHRPRLFRVHGGPQLPGSLCREEVIFEHLSMTCSGNLVVCVNGVAIGAGWRRT